MVKSLKNGIDMQQDVFSILALSDLPARINGGIYLSSRPLNSTKEDIVIGVLTANARQFQTGYLNVNVHVPNLKGERAEEGRAVDNLQPDRERLDEIGSMVANLLDNYEGVDFSLKLRKPGVIEGYKDEWFYNVQIEYSFLRTDSYD